jgi:tRNA (guanine-N7-)-methyltransferase
MGLRRLKRLPLELLQPYLLPLPQPGHNFDWSAVFGNAQPVELEIGFGKGAFLVAAAQAHRDVNYLGIEIERALVWYVASRLAKRGLTHVRLIHGDARTVLPQHVPPDSLQAIHIYFPDPWWKRRHRKRRLVTREFVASCARALAPQGRIRLATDVEEYFQEIQKLFRAADTLAEVPPATQHPWPDVVTNFQRKALEQGRSVWRAEYVKTGSSGSPA